MHTLSAVARLLTLAMSLLLFCACHALPPTASPETTRQKLAAVTSVHFSEQPFSEVIAHFHDRLGLNIVVNWAALKPIDILPETPITLDLSNVTTGRALKAAFNRLPANNDRIAASIDRYGILFISTSDDVRRQTLETRVYNIGDLLHHKPDAPDHGESILATLRAFRPDQWETYSGGHSAIVVNNKLVVAAPSDAFPAIERILAALRDPPGSPPVWLPEDPLDTDDQATRDAAESFHKKLRTPISIAFETTPLYDAIDHIGARTGIHFRVNWEALQQVGVEKDATVSLKLQNIPAGRALAMTFTQLNFADPLYNPVVAFPLEREAVVSAATDRYAIPRRLVLYDLSAFINAASNDDDSIARILAVTEAIQKFSGRPEDWECNAGSASSILPPLRNKIFIRTRPDIHRQIEELLAAFRTHSPSPTRLDTDF